MIEIGSKLFVLGNLHIRCVVIGCVGEGLLLGLYLLMYFKVSFLVLKSFYHYVNTIGCHSSRWLF